VRSWLDRRWTLRETLSRFQELEQEELAQDWPSLRGILRESLLKSGEERYCRVIRAHLPVILHDRPQELIAALRRLEKEYQQLQASSPKPGTAAKDARARRSGTVPEPVDVPSSP
jgi:hypothetical protein